MTEKTFLVIIDTTENRLRQTVGRGILNVHVVTAIDAFEAKRTLLKNFVPNVQEQIKDFLYAYELETMATELKKLQANELMPLFSFLPLAGGRPARQSFAPVQTANLGNNTLDANQPRPQQPQPVQRPQTQQQSSPVPGDVRGRGFNNAERDAQNTPPLTKEQRDLVTSLGAAPQTYGGNEGNVPRVNAAIGGNINLNQNREPATAPGTLTREQMELLRGVGVPTEMTTSAEDIPVDESLTKVEGAPLSEEEILKLKSEIGEA